MTIACDPYLLLYQVSPGPRNKSSGSDGNKSVRDRASAYMNDNSTLQVELVGCFTLSILPQNFNSFRHSKAIITAECSSQVYYHRSSRSTTQSCDQSNQKFCIKSRHRDLQLSTFQDCKLRRSSDGPKQNQPPARQVSKDLFHVSTQREVGV